MSSLSASATDAGELAHFRRAQRPPVFGASGPACAALRKVMLDIRDETAKKRNARDAARVRGQWTLDNNGGAESSFFTALAFASDPVGSVAAASAGRDPAANIVDRARAASLSDEGVWALAARARPFVAPRRACLASGRL